MIEFLTYFFRHNEDGFTSLNMNIIRLLFFLGLIFSYKMRNKKNLLKVLLILGLVLQVILMFWYFGNKDIFLIEGLPFYHCRIAAIMMAITYLSKREKQAKYFAWLGVIGALIAFLIPDPSKYEWPHITNLTYVLCHLNLVITGAMILMNSNLSLSMIDIFKYTLSVNLFIFVANLIFSSNYGYLSSLPQGINMNFPKPVLFLGISLLISLAVGFLEIDFTKVYRRKLVKI